MRFEATKSTKYGFNLWHVTIIDRQYPDDISTGLMHPILIRASTREKARVLGEHIATLLEENHPPQAEAPHEDEDPGPQ